MRGSVRQRVFAVVAALATALSISLASGGFVAHAALDPNKGALWTTNVAGNEVNGNIYANKGDVYLNGGPGAHAKLPASGLPNGDYYFMVTDPSGKVLLSTDDITCRRVTVAGGAFTSVADSDPRCVHATSTGPSGITVQLLPYADTPNHGGVYKAWITPFGDYACPGIAQSACGTGNFGFVHGSTKTDNFKVDGDVLPEIDTRFIDTNTGNQIDGLMITWTDTLGGTNAKWSYYDPSINVNHEAHIEAPEVGTHTITITNQAGCTITGPIQVVNSGTGKFYYTTASGPQSVSVYLSPSMKTGSSIFLYVPCN